MDTPTVMTGVPNTGTQKPARDTKLPTPPTGARARAEGAAGDRAAISARSQAAASRALPEDAAGADGFRVRLGGYDPPPGDVEGASRLARETSRQIVLRPAAAARAQANSSSASVLAMLQ
jgi:hypothetical protein